MLIYFVLILEGQKYLKLSPELDLYLTISAYLGENYFNQTIYGYNKNYRKL
jgi:hypothetical protein